MVKPSFERGQRASRSGNEFEAEIEKSLEACGFLKLTKDFYEKSENAGVQFNSFLSKCLEMNKACFVGQYRPICEGVYAKGRGVTCDFLLFEPDLFPNGLAIEAKWQKSQGSVEEKFPYLVENIKLYPCPAIVIMGGKGTTEGAEKWLLRQANEVENLLAVFPTLTEFETWAQNNLKSQNHKGTSASSNNAICENHKGGEPDLEKLMDSLPENQGGMGRHKCPYCAYYAGLKKGQEIARRQF